MPVISSFYGIMIRMYFAQREHNPPHFHAYYGDHAAAIDINTLDILDGSLPPRARLLVNEWAEKHREQLLEIWTTQNFKQIEPLE